MVDTSVAEIPIFPGESDEDFPWVEPRRWAGGQPDWSATDEMYITYNEEGDRELVTAGEHGIWTKEHSYQRTGSTRYEALRNLAGRTAGSLAGGVGEKARRILPGWAGGTGQFPPIHSDRYRNGAGDRLGRGEGNRSEDHGTSAHGAARHARDRADGCGVPERPGSAAENRVRSHRHCPGCSGHGGTERAGWELAIKAVAAWILGFIAIRAAGIEIEFARFFVVTALAFLTAKQIRPIWRSVVGADDRFAKGGRR